jgi:hypothetical protein
MWVTISVFALEWSWKTTRNPEDECSSDRYLNHGPSCYTARLLLYRLQDDIKMNFGETGLPEMVVGDSGSCLVLMFFLSSWFHKYNTGRCNISANISFLNRYIPVFCYLVMSEDVRTGFMRKTAVWDAGDLHSGRPMDVSEGPACSHHRPWHRDSRLLWNMWSSAVQNVTWFCYKSNLLAEKLIWRLGQWSILIRRCQEIVWNASRFERNVPSRCRWKSRLADNGG